LDDVAAILALFASFGDPAGGLDNAPGSDWVASILVIGSACAANPIVNGIDRLYGRGR
jgi:hypothetical protein